MENKKVEITITKKDGSLVALIYEEDGDFRGIVNDDYEFIFKAKDLSNDVNVAQIEKSLVDELSKWIIEELKNTSSIQTESILTKLIDSYIKLTSK